jgi:hypothetical protein
MNTSAITFDREFWRKLMEGALPGRQLAVDREALVRSLVESIGKWLAENPNIGPHAERVRQIAIAFDQWQRATDRVGGVLREQGIEDATGRYQAENEAFIIFARAQEGLRRWQRLYRPKEGGSEAYTMSLLRKISQLCCGGDPDDSRRNAEERGAGMTEQELEAVLQRLVESGRVPLLDVRTFMHSRKGGGDTGLRATLGQRNRLR